VESWNHKKGNKKKNNHNRIRFGMISERWRSGFVGDAVAVCSLITSVVSGDKGSFIVMSLARLLNSRRTISDD
jgi:hypothetical protein